MHYSCVNRWKQKCKALQKDLDDYKSYSSEQDKRTQSLVKDNELLRAQVKLTIH
jgi:hypothetical protein